MRIKLTFVSEDHFPMRFGEYALLGMAQWIGDREAFDALPRPLDPDKLYYVKG